MQARSELESKRNKLAKLRGVAGIKEEKISDAERELNDAAKKVETATKEYEEIVTRMSEDLARFQVKPRPACPGCCLKSQGTCMD